MLVLSGCLFCGLYGCEDFVETDLPQSQLTGETVFKEKATATAAMVDIYAQLRNGGLLTGKSIGISSQLGIYTDELDYYGSQNDASFDFYNNSVLPGNAIIGQLWASAYNQIYAANAIISGLANATAIEEADKNVLIGEALFTRALLHFYLAGLYGDIPYITTTDYISNGQVSRQSYASVCDKVIEDLEDAKPLLKETYASGGRTRPNRAAASALLARVYLYSGHWAEASNEASAVLNQSERYQMEATPATVFLKASKEAIWQFNPPANGNNANEGDTFIFTQGPPPQLALRQTLIDAFAPGDLRRSSWIKAVTTAGNTWYHANKYTQPTTNGTGTEYSVVLRLAEQYLIRAEARAIQGDLIGAKQDLNVVRARAGLEPTVAVTQVGIVEAVLAERQRELFTEYGHRFFDLKRTGNLDASMAPVKPTWDSNCRFWPLPENELRVNANLRPQNPGY